MKYFLDTEFIEGFHKPLFGKRRHFIDLISIGIVREDGQCYHAISSEYNYDDADPWVKENVIHPLYIKYVHGDARNRLSVRSFHKTIGTPLSAIKRQILDVFGCWKDTLYWRAPAIQPEIYGYYADYDWVLFCSLLGRMIDLPKGFPMYCIDLKQMMDEKISPSEQHAIGYENALKRLKLKQGYPAQYDEHDAIADARWNKDLYNWLTDRKRWG